MKQSEQNTIDTILEHQSNKALEEKNQYTDKGNQEMIQQEMIQTDTSRLTDEDKDLYF